MTSVGSGGDTQRGAVKCPEAGVGRVHGEQGSSKGLRVRQISASCIQWPKGGGQGPEWA